MTTSEDPEVQKWVDVKDSQPPDETIVVVEDVTGSVALAKYTKWESTHNYTIIAGGPVSGRIVRWYALHPRSS